MQSAHCDTRQFFSSHLHQLAHLGGTHSAVRRRSAMPAGEAAAAPSTARKGPSPTARAMGDIVWRIICPPCVQGGEGIHTSVVTPCFCMRQETK